MNRFKSGGFHRKVSLERNDGPTLPLESEPLLINPEYWLGGDIQGRALGLEADKNAKSKDFTS